MPKWVLSLRLRALPGLHLVEERRDRRWVGQVGVKQVKGETSVDLAWCVFLHVAH